LRAAKRNYSNTCKRRKFGSKTEGPKETNALFLTGDSLGSPGQLAFVFPGSGNHFPDMGRQFGVEWPAVLRRQDAENQYLRGQLVPQYYWNQTSVATVACKDMIFGQVALGTVISDLLADFGVRPDVVLGYSLGESAALFALRACKTAMKCCDA